MSRTSPPKPWERPGSSNPIRPTLSPSSPMVSSAPSATSLTTTNTPRPPLRPWERRGVGSNSDYDSYSRSSYGGYGNYGSSYGNTSGYGSSGYGGYGSNSSLGGGYGSSYGRTSSYGDYGYGRDRDYGGGYGGGGGYGSSSYGRSYGDYGGGFGSGGGGYGGYGGGYGRDPYDKSITRGFSFFNNLQYFVDSFSRFSRLLDANYDAMHGSFASVVRLLEHMGRLNFEVMTVIKTFALFRVMQSVISRTFGVFGFLLPWRSSSSPSPSPSSTTLSVRDFQQFANLPPSSSTSPGSSPHPPHTPPSWRTLLVVFLVTFVGLPMLVNRMFNVLSRRNMELEWNKEAGGGEEVVAVHEFRGESGRELSFNKGDVLTVINKFHPDWWEASLNGQVGVIPANHVSSSSSHPDNPPDDLKLSK